MKQYIKYLACFSAILSVAAGVTLDLTADKSEVEEGGTVTLLLKIANFQPGSNIKWTKESGDDFPIAALANNHMIETDYAERNYKADLNDVGGGNYEISFVISDAKLEDAGLYKVDWADGTNSAHAETKISVIRAPEQVQLFYDGAEVSQDEEFEIEPDSTHSLKCQVKGVAPTPDVDILAGDVVVSDNVDEFMQEVTIDQSNEVANALYEITYAVAVEGQKVTFDSKFANKMVKCVVKGPSGTISSAGFKAKFPGVPPSWDTKCPREAFSFNGQEDFELSCTFTASPPAEVEYLWHYRNPAATDEIRITADMLPRDYPVHYSAATETVDDSTQKATLKMDMVKPQMFRNYTMIAKNEIGESSYVVTLVRDTAKEVSTGSATNLLSSAFLLSLTIVASFLFHHS